MQSQRYINYPHVIYHIVALPWVYDRRNHRKYMPVRHKVIDCKNANVSQCPQNKSNTWGVKQMYCTEQTIFYYEYQWTHAFFISWPRCQMETFAALLALCAGNSRVIGEFPSQRPVTRCFDVFFYLCLNKRLSKQSWIWWFEALSRLIWRHCY